MFEKIPAFCESCKRSFDVSLSDARDNKTIPCPKCGDPISIEGKDAAKEIDRLNDAIKNAGFK